MILLLDTSTPLCKLSLIDGDAVFDDEWQADRGLAKGLFDYISSQLVVHEKSWKDITGIGVFVGPGSFTGLRIGLTVMNTIADASAIPIVGGSGDDWRDEAIEKLHRGEDEKMILPHYGGEANITAPRK